jgi:hypothetical protein
MSQRLLFIGGFPSSGTDLLRNVIHAHPQVNVSPEFPELFMLADRWGAAVRAEKLGEALADFRRLARPFLVEGDSETLASSPHDGAIALADIYASFMPGRFAWKGNKTPQNAENIALLARTFPESRFLLIVRDARDVVLSWRRKWGKDPYVCAAKWSQRVCASRAQLDLLEPRRRFIIRFEDLLENPQVWSSRLCDWLGLEFSDRMLRHHTFTSPVPGKRNFNQPINAVEAGKWRRQMPEPLAVRVEELAREGLELFGYPIDAARRAAPLTRVDRCVGGLRDGMATLFVGNRELTGVARMIGVGKALRTEWHKQVRKWRRPRRSKDGDNTK